MENLSPPDRNRHPQNILSLFPALATIFIIHLAQGNRGGVLCVFEDVIFCCTGDKFEIVSSMQEWLQSNLTCQAEHPLEVHLICGGAKETWCSVDIICHCFFAEWGALLETMEQEEE